MARNLTPWPRALHFKESSPVPSTTTSQKVCMNVKCVGVPVTVIGIAIGVCPYIISFYICIDGFLDEKLGVMNTS